MTDFGGHPIDVSRPTAARLYDYYLSGTNNYRVDRTVGDQILEVCPIMPTLARQNRAFLARAVMYAVTACGIRQFVDVGSGIPTQGNVHEIAQAAHPSCRVVYVDNDEEAVVTGQTMLRGNAAAACIEGDFVDPATVLEHPDTQRLIDFTQPTALLVVALLHFIGDQHEPQARLREYLGRLAPGSVFVASHVAVDEAADQERDYLLQAERLYGDTANPGTIRTRDEFAGFYAGLDLVDPGVTYAADWRSTGPVSAEEQPARRCLYAGVGTKP